MYKLLGLLVALGVIMFGMGTSFAAPVCYPYTGYYTSQPASNNANGCLTGTYADTGDATTGFQWTCTASGSQDVFACMYTQGINSGTIYGPCQTGAPLGSTCSIGGAFATGLCVGICQGGNQGTYCRLNPDPICNGATCIAPQAVSTGTETAMCRANKQLYNVYECTSLGKWNLAIMSGCANQYYDSNTPYQAGQEVCTGALPPSTNCTVCGDIETDLSEACDDGNVIDSDSCTNSCENPACGDSIVTSYQLATGSHLICKRNQGGVLGYCGTGAAINSACSGNSLTGTCVGVCQSTIGSTRTSCTQQPYATGTCANGDPCVGLSVSGSALTEECDLGSVCVGGVNNGSYCQNEPPSFCGAGTCTPKDDATCQECVSVCNSPVLYPPEAVPGWSCPDGRWLYGCPGNYLCRRELIESIMCLSPVCGDGHIDGIETCDEGKFCDDGTNCTLDRGVCPGGEDECHTRQSVTCNPSCMTPACGDGYLFTGTAVGTTRNWSSSGATNSRTPLVTGQIITYGQGGLTYVLTGRGPADGDLFGYALMLMSDIDNDGIEDLMASAPGKDFSGGMTNNGQLLGLSFDITSSVKSYKPYFQSQYLRSGAYVGAYLANMGEMDRKLGLQPIFNRDDPMLIVTTGYAFGYGQIPAVLALGTYQTYSGNNFRLVHPTPPQIITAIQGIVIPGDLDNNGYPDLIKEKILSNQTQFETVLLSGTTPLAYGSSSTALEGTNVLDVDAVPVGDMDNDGIGDIIVGMIDNNILQIWRFYYNSNGSRKTKQSLLTSGTNLQSISMAYGKDINADGMSDLIYVGYDGTANLFRGEMVLLNTNRTVKSRLPYTVALPLTGIPERQNTHDMSFFPDVDGDGNVHVVFGLPYASGYKGALYTYELQSPYGHAFSGITEQCDEGSFCSNGVNCTANPNTCPLGSSDCQVRYVNGCTSNCQLGCGNGAVDSDGIDDIPGNSDDEQCDDGNTSNKDTCTNTCKFGYCGDGYTQNPNASGFVEQCDGGPACTPSCFSSGTLLNGMCNFASKIASGYNYTGTSTILSAYGAQFFCNRGSLANLAYSSNGWTRTCQGVGGGGAATCSMPSWRCSDGVVDTWTGSNGIAKETCDDGNLTNGDGCNATCKFESPYQPRSSNKCTITTYPQIEKGELLPIWWKGTTYGVATGTITCNSSYTGPNKVMRNSSLKGNFGAYRGSANGIVMITGVYTTGLLNSYTGISGAPLIQDAMTDFAVPAGSRTDVLGASLIPISLTNSWIGEGTGAAFGQYMLRMSSINFDYCATTRISSKGTVTGNVATGGSAEDCTNNQDDDGDGAIDCADLSSCPAGTGQGQYSNCIAGQGSSEVGSLCHNFTGVNNDIPVDDDGDTYANCADGNCSNSSYCIIEACGVPGDQDGDGLSDADDPDCEYFLGSPPVPPVPPSVVKHAVTYASSTGAAICEAKFAVSKGYFVQAGVVFTEQENTGLDINTFTSIDGTSLVSEGTPIDETESENMIATYQGAGKAYLFDQFIDGYLSKAVFTYSFWTNGRYYEFKKVPNAHIYYRNDDADLYRNDTVKDDLFEAVTPSYVPGVSAEPSFTIIAADSTVDLHIEGSVAGNGMYMAVGDISFDSTNCDSSDEVEGMFLTKGQFFTTTIHNDSASASHRCRGGNLAIKGILLGENAGSDLATQRRSVLDAWSTGAYLFSDNNNVIYQAKDLFETCYLPALLQRHGNVVLGMTDLTAYTAPVAGCNIETLFTGGGVSTGLHMTADALNSGFLNSFVTTVFYPALSCTTSCATPKVEFVRSMMDQAQPGGTGNLLIPNTVVIVKPNGTSLTINLNTNKKLTNTLANKMWLTNKLFPLRWFKPDRYNANTKVVTINLTKFDDRKEMLRDLSRVFNEVKQDIIGFKKPLQMVGTTSQIDVNPFNTFLGRLKSYLNPPVGLTSPFAQNYGNNCQNSPYNGYSNFVTNSSQAACRISYYPDFKWMIDNATTAKTQVNQASDQIVGGSSVSITTQPTSWTQLAPGARNFLQSLVITPR